MIIIRLRLTHTSNFLFTLTTAAGSNWAAANTSLICASRCSSKSDNFSNFFSKSTFFKPVFCCNSNIAETNLECNSSLSD